MNRLIIVFNPRSSKADLVRKEVFEPAMKLPGFFVAKFEVAPTDVNDNARKLSKIIRDGDLVLSAGGDATASIGINGVIFSGKKAIFSFLPFGNFNDTAASFGEMDFSEVISRFLKKKFSIFSPIEVSVDSSVFRYGISYVTVGMMAEATEIFNEKKMRKKLQEGKGRFCSYFSLAKWYFSHRKERFLPEGTDYFVMNGLRAGGIMKGDTYFASELFSVGRFDLKNPFRLFSFMMKSVFSMVPGDRRKQYHVEFVEKTPVCIHMEGEKAFLTCKDIIFSKSVKVQVIRK